MNHVMAFPCIIVDKINNDFLNNISNTSKNQMIRNNLQKKRTLIKTLRKETPPFIPKLSHQIINKVSSLKANNLK
jgi:hypothetical protein